MGRLSFGVLGPLSVTTEDEPVKLGGPKERLLLAALLLHAGRVVSTRRLVDILWAEDPPARAQATLQVHVSNLRKRLEPHRPGIDTCMPGYLVAVTSQELDLLRFEELTDQARQRAAQGERGEAALLFDHALKLWRGPALADQEAAEYVESSRALLEERRLCAEEERLTLLLELARNQEALVLAEQMLEHHPLREALWGHQMIALYRLGRQADALATFRRCRAMLLDDLGIDPTPPLRELEAAILRQDPVLDPPLRPTGVAGPAFRSPVPGAATTFVAAAARAAALVRDDGSEVGLTDVVTLGRNPDCDVVLLDPLVSRRHAEVRPALSGHLIRDLMSSNGTKVGDHQVMHHMLQDGDVIEIGTQTLRYVMR